MPNEGRPGKGMRLRPAFVIAIEPMLIADGTDDYTHDPDGWTLRTVGRPRREQRAHGRGHRRRPAHPDQLTISPNVPYRSIFRRFFER